MEKGAGWQVKMYTQTVQETNKLYLFKNTNGRKLQGSPGHNFSPRNEVLLLQEETNPLKQIRGSTTFDGNQDV